MARRWGWLALALLLVAAAAAGAAERRHAARAVNPVNQKLLAMKPADRAALLAKAVGHWCIGTEAFPMGVTKTGRGAGNAYWSLRCADGSAWAVQIDPLAEVTAINCGVFNAMAEGKQCFKRF
ncbi:MAG TPA: hypothetical protein VMF86_01905 [Stellaceae bacterium]|nr:hypothetical protein [Stellaceae bacterium]